MRLLTSCITPMLVAGCAGTDVYPVSSPYPLSIDGNAVTLAADNDKVNGFRYYEGAHFLIVYSDGKGGLKSEIKFLPDLTRMRAIHPYAYLAKNDTTLTFANGMLTNSKSVIDESILPKAVVGAATKIALADIAANKAGGSTEENTLPEPEIYKITFDAKTGALQLLKGTTTEGLIKVTLQEEK